MQSSRAQITFIAAFCLTCLTACRTTAPARPAGPTAIGTALRGPLPQGFEQLVASDPDASAATEAGGFVLREIGKKNGASIGAVALSNLTANPADAKTCTAVSTQTIHNSGFEFVSAEVVDEGGRRLCRSEGRAGTALVSRSYAWTWASARHFGAMVTCAMTPADTTAAEACRTVVRGVTAVAN